MGPVDLALSCLPPALLSVVDIELSKLSMELLRVIWARLLWLALRELLPLGVLTADGVDIVQTQTALFVREKSCFSDFLLALLTRGHLTVT